MAETEEGDVNEVSTAKKEAKVEGRQGFELWRSITRVVCLTVNVRAPGVLSRLQAEMRDGHISDEMWNLSLSDGHAKRREVDGSMLSIRQA